MNPVQLEIVKIDRQWRHVVKHNPQVPLFICLGERHELNLFESYFKYQLSDDSTTDDIFMIHYQAFGNSNTYGQALVDEWKEVYDLWQDDNQAVPGWDMHINNVGKFYTDAFKPVMALAHLHTLYPSLKELKIFVHLAPTSINNAKNFELWVNEWCRCAKGLDNVKLVFTDHHTHRTLKTPKDAYSFLLKIDIHQLMQNAAAHTNPQKNDIESDYQHQILTASNYLSKGKHEPAHVALERAVQIAKKQGLKEPEAAARLMLAQSHAAIGNNREAETQFQFALVVAGNDTLIGAQMQMNYASYLLSKAKNTEAIACFNNAVTIAGLIGNDFIAMECTRMIGQLSESIWGSSKSMDCYRKCIEIGKKMPLAQRRQSSMAYIAEMVKKKQGEYSEESKQLDREMTEYIGEDWQTLTKMPENHTHPN